ncbi:MAG: UDP-glucose 4-epimerase GalE [Dehalococcoidales bacterium]|nr:UDP-glucose 4-epimerase GalE [Dehalococcoidales bacterium]
MAILVTGAAGYIGSVVVEELLKAGKTVIALDNLSQGYRQAVAPEAVFIRTDLADLPGLESAFRHSTIESVIHLAALSIVERSMSDPASSFRNNIVGGLNLLDVMLKYGVTKFVFSSSAAVYGEPDKAPIKEMDAKRPLNPYGESKLMFERILYWYGQAYGLKSVSLRYFNASGASEHCGECHHPETHLIPNILKVASGQFSEVSVYGTDYPTSDGSCIRDYVHVLDIAQAHILALEYLPKSNSAEAFNLGNDKGFSVLEVVETARKVTGTQIRTAIHPRRPGDPAVLVASSELARSKLGWQPQFTEMEDIIGSAWRWQKTHPHGYS